MNFCSQCGNRQMEWRIPEGDNRPRHVCDSCDTIFYSNPKIVAGCIPTWNDQVLLCKRAIEPRYGYWTLPAGFMENAETTVEAAARETLEEANARVTVGQLYTVLSIPHTSQVYMMFLAGLEDLEFHAGSESLEVELFKQAEIPWDELAFPTISHTLKFYFDDLATGRFALRTGDIVREGSKARFILHSG